ncbi:serine hydrolase domain-containing protein [Paenibacillus sp. FSL R5-0766]|uniref:serine hydrolase domain-containing protein n=1 Tax=unclassified Paenibacillus TaxID=185978 RepID=UPI00096EA9FD|nr:serine hydrolase domain-containing protein [Paenibacillus sp. FSL R5-0765]OMF59911.1 hypothetical protein BK141_23905 [Paenibacillus sp. FSL R5-0765]
MSLVGTRVDLAGKMKELLDAKVNKNATAISAAFIKDGELIAALAYGTQDGNPDNPATVHDLYNVGSISKIYCAIAVMKLVEMGKVNLDVSVTEYLPRFRMQDKRYKQITLRTCLNHSSGLPGANLKYSFSTKWLTEDIYEEFYDYFSKSKLKDTPGNNSVYCNDGYILAEMVVAEVSGISFIQFVQDHIAKPVGALSTFSGGNIPENRVRVKEKEKKEEYIMCTGSGGIITNIIDCAKIGYLFIDPKEVFKPESLHETCLSQGKSVITGIAENFGLGWDSVNFSLEPYDFGENVLVKSGATNMFRTFLLVSQKYKLAAAISVTNDNRIVVYDILSELCSLLLDEYNINTRKKKKEKEFDIEKKPIPVEYAERFSGVYYNNTHSFRAIFDNDSLKIQFRKQDVWEDWVTELFYDGQRFVSNTKPFIFTFENHEKNSYLINTVPFWGKNPMAQKCTSFPSLTGKWKSRVGKKYIVCDAHPADTVLTPSGFSLTIKEFENEEGVLFFAYTGPFGTDTLPVTPSGEWETEMILNAPLQGARKGFAPYIYEKGGVEYLYAFGYNLIDSVYIKPLQSGRVISIKGRQNKIFSMKAGNKLHIDKPADVRIIILNSELEQKFDSESGLDITETCDGFILFINEGTMNFSVEIS